jgi:death-on-curing protein
MSAERQTWVWIDHALIHAVHDEQLAEHGGGAGVRDANLLDSALARSEQLASYGMSDAADLAASYAYGISRNHPFVDGNKRTAFVAMELFLALNGFDLVATDLECVTTMLSVAAGDIEEAAYADWIRAHIRPR